MVLTGSEKAFAAGADIKEMQAKTYHGRLSRGLLLRAGTRSRASQADHRGRLRALRWAAAANWR